jgi:hypothetical protein
MNRWNPCRRSLFIRRLQALGFEGPYSGSKHQFMTFANHRQTIPSNDEYSVPQLRMMIKEVESIIGREITASEWNGF